MITKSVPARAGTRTFATGIGYITRQHHEGERTEPGRSFESGVAYATAPDKAAWTHLRGVMSLETAAIEMEAVAALSRRCKDPVYHLIIAYAKHEQPTRAEMVSDAERLLGALGMEKNQYVLAAHMDTDDLHAHVIANRVGPDGRANDLWRERIVRERVCAEIAAERGWDIVVGRHNRDIVERIGRLHELPSAPQRRLNDGDYRRLLDHGEIPWQDAARPYVLEAVERARDWPDLHRRLGEHRLVVKLVRRGDRVQGLAFAESDDAAALGCGASRIADRCKLSALEARFGTFIAREREHEGLSPKTPSGIGDEPRAAPWRQEVRDKILAAVDSARSWDELTKALAAHGIVVKLVERGGRVQGLAFAQGHSADAPGCGASRIDDRCKKSALEARFGPFPRIAPSSQMRCPRHEPARPSAREYVRIPSRNQTQGPAHARSTQRDASQKKQCSEPGTQRERFLRDATRDPEWALRHAQGIAEHAKVRTDYRAYREEFNAKHSAERAGRREDAWQRERAQRHLEAQRRWEARRFLRAVARLTMRGIARQIAYWTIDVASERRRAQEWLAARARWEATKIVFRAQCRVEQERPMGYRAFVVARAIAGDPASVNTLSSVFGVDVGKRRAESRPSHATAEVSVADAAGLTSSARRSEPRPQRPAEALGSDGGSTARSGDRGQPRRSEWASAPAAAQSANNVKASQGSLSLSEVGAQLARIGNDATGLYQEAKARRVQRECVEPPSKLEAVLAAERARLHTKVVHETNFTDAEKKQLTELRARLRSWSPVTRSIAKAQEQRLLEARERRLDDALRAAEEHFARTDIPSIEHRHRELQRRHQAYIRASVDDEDQMRRAQQVIRESLPRVARRLDVLKRAGVATIETVGDTNDLAGIAPAVEAAYRRVPPAVLAEIEKTIRQEHARVRPRGLDRNGP